MKCPRCAAECQDHAVDCAACGIVFKKWRELKQKERRAAAETIQSLEMGDLTTPPAPRMHRWASRTLAGGFILIWMSALAIYMLTWSHRHLRSPRPAVPVTQSPKPIPPGN